jgi:hypothetical protein
MSFASTSTEFAMIDTRTTSGAFVLPLTSDIPGRIINIKDAYGTFTNSSLTVYTQGGEAFEDGTNFRLLNNSWEQLQVYTASTTRWYITGGTEQNITTTNIGVFSTLQTFNWPSLCNTAGFGYGSTFNPTALGRISLLDNIFTSSTAGLVSTFIEMGNLNAQPAIMSTGGAFRWLMGVEPDVASMGRGLQFKIKRWNSFQVPNGATFYGANISTLLDTVNINSLGFVGINNSTPQYTLDVNGGAMLRSALLINDGNQAATNLFRNNYLYTQLFSSTLQVGFSNYAAALQMINRGGYNGTSLPALLIGPSTPTQTSPILELFTPAANDNNVLRLGDPLGQLRLTAGGSYGGIRWTDTTSTLRGPQLYFGSNGININSTFTASLYALDVNGLGRSRIIISTLTTNPSFAPNSYGTYYNMSNTGITGAILPQLAATDNGWFVVLRNNTPVTLNMAWTGTTTGLPSSSNTIPASNSLTLAWNGSAYIYY